MNTKTINNNKNKKHKQRPINDKTKEPAWIPLQNALQDLRHTAKPICTGVAQLEVNVACWKSFPRSNPWSHNGHRNKRRHLKNAVRCLLKICGEFPDMNIFLTSWWRRRRHSQTMSLLILSALYFLSLKEGGGNTEEITAWWKETRMLKSSSTPKCTLLFVWRLHWDVWPQRAQSIELLCWARLFHWIIFYSFLAKKQTNKNTKTLNCKTVFHFHCVFI